MHTTDLIHPPFPLASRLSWASTSSSSPVDEEPLDACTTSGRTYSTYSAALAALARPGAPASLCRASGTSSHLTLLTLPPPSRAPVGRGLPARRRRLVCQRQAGQEQGRQADGQEARRAREAPAALAGASLADRPSHNARRLTLSSPARRFPPSPTPSPAAGPCMAFPGPISTCRRRGPRSKRASTCPAAAGRPSRSPTEGADGRLSPLLPYITTRRQRSLPFDDPRRIMNAFPSRHARASSLEADGQRVDA